MNFRRALIGVLLWGTCASAGEAPHGKLQAFLGRWEGSCSLTPAYQGMNTLAMGWTLIPQKMAAGSRPASYRYELDYGADDHRPYELIATDDKAHFTLDEHNGILISVEAISSELLSSAFTVQGKHLETRFELSPCRDKKSCRKYWDDRLLIRIWSLSERCVQTEDKNACPVLAMQDCTLTRKKTVDSPQL